MVGVAQPASNFGGHVQRRTEQAARLTVPHAGGKLRHAEVEDLDQGARRLGRWEGQEDAVRFQRPVHELPRMRGAEQGSKLPGDVGEAVDVGYGP